MRTVELHSPELGWSPRVVVHGSYGRPVLAFPSSEGRAEDWQTHGMVDALRPLLDAGRVKLYCLDSWDGGSWYREDLPLEERARRHEAYERWVVEGAVPFVDADCGGRQEMVVTGCSFGAYHAVNIALRRADLFPLAIGLSGVYDLSVLGWGERGTSFHLNTPLWSLAAAEGAHLDWLRRAAVAAARRRPGQVGGHHRRPRQHPCARRARGREGAARRDRPVGSRRAARLALVADAARLPPAPLRLEEST